MRVGLLIDQLGDQHGVEFQGKRDREFRGASLRTSRGPVRRRYALIVDDGWSRGTRRRYLPDGVTADEKIREAFANGAAGIICNSDLKGLESLKGRNVIFCDNTFLLFCRVVEAVMGSLTTQKVTAVTGSAGKSTTKAMIAHALTRLDLGRVYSEDRNWNLAQDVLSQLSRAGRSEHTVVEVAGSVFPRFQGTGFSVSPPVAILTSISEAHLDYLHDLESVARIKSDLFVRPPAGGAAVINADAPHADLVIQRARDEGWRLVTYGEAESADIRLISYDWSTRKVIALVHDDRFEYKVGPPGRHMAMNSLAVIAALRAHSVFYWREGVRSLEYFEPLGGRGKTTDVTLAHGARITLVDEAYNANPASMRAALEMVSALQVSEGSRKIAVLGDIMELSDSADAVHRSLSEAVLTADVDEFHLFGEHMSALHEEVRGRLPNVKLWNDLDAMAAGVIPHLRSGDLMLAKASGSTGLKDFVKTLDTGVREAASIAE